MTRRREPNTNAAPLIPLLRAVGRMVHAETEEQAEFQRRIIVREWEKLEAREG